MQMNIRQLEAFRAVMIARTVIGAAELLKMSQPAVSRLLQGFEESVGITLFDRSSGRLVPTPEALVLFEEVERTFISVEKIKEIARDLRTLDAGTLNIAALPLLALGFLPRVIHEFSTMHPKIRVTLNVRMSTKVEEWASAQMIDFGIADFPFGMQRFERSGIEADEFCRVPYLLGLPEGHRLQHKKLICPEDLEGERFVSLTNTTVAGQFINDVFESRNIKRTVVTDTNLFSVAVKNIASGLGVGFVDPFTAFDYKDLGVVTVPFEPSIFLRLGLLHPVHRPLTRVAKEFISLLRQRRQEILLSQQAHD